MQTHDSYAEFPSTQWTDIDVLRENDNPRHAEALEAISRRYWPPIYAYLRRRGKSRNDAAETTQAFFADVVLTKRLFEQADPHRGRLRALILTALKRYVVNESKRRSARAVELGISMERLEQEEAFVAGEDSDSAETTFDRRWATAVLEHALEQCRQHFVSSGRGRHWAIFERRVLLPSVSMRPPPSYTHAAQQAGFSSAAEAAAALRTVRKRAQLLLYDSVAATARGHPDQLAEFRLIESLLG